MRVFKFIGVVLSRLLGYVIINSLAIFAAAVAAVIAAVGFAIGLVVALTGIFALLCLLVGTMTFAVFLSNKDMKKLCKESE